MISLKTEEHLSFKNLRFLWVRKIFAACGSISCKFPSLGGVAKIQRIFDGVVDEKT